MPSPAQAQIQLRCDGTLLEARGSAERELTIGQLRFSLSLEAEQRSSDGALALLQERLASIRSVLQGLQVRELRVSSPSTWQRPAESGKPAITQASLQVSGLLDPSRLQALIRQGGALPGVRLAPVSAEADPARSGDTRRALLAAAYRQAFHRAQDVASALGLASLRPLEVQAEDDRPPYVARAPMAAKAEVPPFDPNELTPPKDSASMLVRFCAR
ncbi:MAG: SIMPL domain-containing protein [Cyanobacteriota bacterium]|nr:SIMPL domain-containing protein [Cyanobacteriota bacterium]